MSGAIAVIPRFQFSNSLGVPLAGGLLDVYEAGTTTLANTWQDRGLTTLNTNPVVLDSSGSCTIWLDENANYKFRLRTSAGAVLWTVDNISGASAQQLSQIEQFTDYATLRLYAGAAPIIIVTSAGVNGTFCYDSTDVSTADNGGTVLVDGLGRRWKRQIDGDVLLDWFQPAGNGTTDDTAKFQAADDYAASVDRDVWVDWRNSYSITRFIPDARFVSDKTVTFTGDSIPVERAAICRDSTYGLGLTENAVEFFFAGDFTSTTNCTVTTAGQTLVFEKTGAGSVATHPSAAIPTTKDWIAYFQLKMSSGASGEVANLLIGPAGSSMAFSLGYNWPAGAAAAGAVSVKWNASTKLLLSGADYVSAYMHFVLHYDSDFQCLNIYQKNDTTKAYSFLGTVAGAFVYDNDFGVSFGGTSSSGLTLTMGAVKQFCRPNIVAIGDSVCKGATLYDPNPASADKDYTSCWESYVKISEVENTLIVNKGIGGQTSLQIYNRVADDVVAQAPAMCVLHLSSNDENAGISYANRTTYVQNSINLCRAAGIRVTLLSAVYPNSNHADYPDITDYMQRYMTDVDGFNNLVGYSEYIDFMADAVGDANNEATPSLFQSDGIHPKPAGYALIGGLIQSYWVDEKTPQVYGGLEVRDFMRVRGLIYGQLADARPWGWQRIQYTNGTTSWAITASSDNVENNGFVSVAYNGSAADLNITFSQTGIVPSSFMCYGTAPTVVCIARLVTITAGTGTQVVARYQIVKVTDGSTPTGANLDLMQFHVAY